MAPQRIQRQRTNGWRTPEGAIYVGRPSKWGNPFRYRTPSGLVREPSAHSDAPLEYETRISADGMRHDYYHPDGRVTQHTIRYATLTELVEVYRSALLTGIPWGPRMPTVEEVRRELAGHDLICWCPVTQPCHGDVLLAVANETEGAQ